MLARRAQLLRSSTALSLLESLRRGPNQQQQTAPNRRQQARSPLPQLGDNDRSSVSSLTPADGVSEVDTLSTITESTAAGSHKNGEGRRPKFHLKLPLQLLSPPGNRNESGRQERYTLFMLVLLVGAHNSVIGTGDSLH